MTGLPLDFPLVICEGAFLNSGERLHYVDGSGVTASLSAALEPMIGRPVRLSAHHFPPNPPDLTRRGAGACLYAPGACPVGHNTDAAWMYSYTGAGVLGRKRDGRWRLTTDDGVVVDPGFEALYGHRARVVCVAADFTGGGAADSLVGRVGELKAALDRLRGIS